MGDSNKGTEFDIIDERNDWYIVREAECVDSLHALDELFEESTNESIISNLIDDETDLSQGNSLALFNAHIQEDCDKAILDLKRKYNPSPQKSIAELSPRLEAVTISPQRLSKRRLFEDSGVVDDEAENLSSQVATVAVETNTSDLVSKAGSLSAVELLQTSNRTAIIMSKFKEKFGVSYTDLTREFKSNKSSCVNWIITVYRASEEVLEASKQLLVQHCEFFQIIIVDFSALFMVQFKAAKSRETIMNLFCKLLNVSEMLLMCNPPKHRSVPVALYFVQKANSNCSFVYGQTPDWIAKQTLLQHQAANNADAFKLSEMIQWAYDNNYTEEPEIAYYYAIYADVDANATAFLHSNQQSKYVRDCSRMVKLYKRQEMLEMSMSDWIFRCCDECGETADWKVIAQFIKYQNIHFVEFLTALRTWFKRIPKKNAIVLYGPPDTGKSYFSFSLMRFLHGKVVSFCNRQSQFWLQPLKDCKVGFMDDCTYNCWVYIDQNMRNGLDGNAVSVDAKHNAPVQIRLPPLMITTNINVKNEMSLKYIHSRVVCFEFPNPLPFNDDGSMVYQITDASWKCFFERLAVPLDLTRPEEEGDESKGPSRPFRCTAGPNNDSL
ncbi:E1 [Gammapapillomavirus sp.]|uniref:E1 n=1 Tax=Gammapapillomavirus sp. TaxID=2049444 RepID=UPI000C583143|nr:E1 [Gammapapillomavirus sp.]ATQ38177.1 E1 [Gammapapillomavirus sp.]